MRRLTLFLLALAALGSPGDRAPAVQYEPPMNILFIIHVEEMPNYAEYEARIACLQWLEAEALSRPFPFKMTILMNGDFCEYVVYRGDQEVFASLEANDHELGTHAHPIIQMGPLNWVNVGEQTSRYGIPIYNAALTQQIWSDATRWVDSLTAVNVSICAMPLLCSDEGQLTAQFGFTSDPGNRSEKGLDYFGHLVRHPFRPAADDRLGYELAEDLNGPFVYLDHYAQIGNTNAHGYNCTEPAMEVAFNQCYQEWLMEEMTQGDSLDYKVWTFGVLTHDWLWSPYYEQQVSDFLDFIEANFVGHYTPRGNLIARYATCSDVVAEFETWEVSHPGESSFSYIHPYPQVPKINEAMIIPRDLTPGSEWIEFYNPNPQWINISGYEITNGMLVYSDFWRFPPSSWMGPNEYLIAAHNGVNFRDCYGFRPDFEVSGSTGARELFPGGAYSLHDDNDCCALTDTSHSTPNTNTAVCDALSWGQCYTAGFTLIPPSVNQTYGRDANSTDTGYSTDWHLNGGTTAPTPGGANAAAFFAPQVFVNVDPRSVPALVNPGGGALRLRVEIGNEMSTVQVIDFWTNVIQPSGAIVGPLITRLNRAIAPQDSFYLIVNQYIPGSWAGGFHRYNIYIGDYPNSTTDLAYLYFEKLGNGGGNSGTWPVADVLWPGEQIAEVVWSANLPERIALTASPNPFNASTNLRVALPQDGDLLFEAFDVAGRTVFTKYWEALPAGYHQVEFDGRGLSSGIYLLKMRSPAGEAIAKVTLIK
jgi:hypothetical protein